MHFWGFRVSGLCSRSGRFEIWILIFVIFERVGAKSARAELGGILSALFVCKSKAYHVGGKHGSIWQNCVLNPVLQGFLTLNVFTRPFFLFAPFAGHPSSSPFLSTFSPFSPPRKVLCSVEQRAQRRAWRGAAPGWTSPTKFGKEIPSRNLREKRSVFDPQSN